MTTDEIIAWAEAQVQALMEAEVDGFDAEATVKRAAADLPDDGEVLTFVPEWGAVEVTEAVIDDARAEFYLSAPPKMKRLLDATVVPNG